MRTLEHEIYISYTQLIMQSINTAYRLGVITIWCGIPWSPAVQS